MRRLASLWFFSIFGALFVALLSCGSSETIHVLAGRNITVEVRANPYGITVRDGSGRAVLSSRDGGGDVGRGEHVALVHGNPFGRTTAVTMDER